MLVRSSPISPPSSSSELTSASGERGKKVCGTALRFVFEAIAAAAAAALRGRTDTATHLHARLPHYSGEFRRQAMLCPHRERRTWRRPRPRTCLSLPEVPPPPQPLLHSRLRLLRLPPCLPCRALSLWLWRWPRVVSDLLRSPKPQETSTDRATEVLFLAAAAAGRCGAARCAA